MKQVKSKTAVFKNGRKTAKSDSHTNNRQSVFGKKTISMNPLDALLANEASQPKKPRRM